ncbi:MAG: hypothetical protein Q4E75_00675 [bacterium]|nr:hypothetical protein [bacterium]
MDISFYNMSVRILGELPITLTWLYDLTTLFLVITTFCVFIIPISIIFKKVVR